jgi:hypothetical protein
MTGEAEMTTDKPGGYLVTPDEAVPEVRRAPAPWTLYGSAWILVLKFPGSLRQGPDHVTPALRGTQFRGPSVVMFVDYRDSPVGPYRELLYIPGRFTDEGEPAWSVTRIWVSTWESVVNGRLNWGIPKDRADFVRDKRAGEERITVLQGGAQVARLDLAALGPAFPVNTGFVPRVLRHLVQYHGGRRFSLALSASGRARAARLLLAEGGTGLFPDLAAARVLATVRVSRFTMTFPKAVVTNASAQERP